MVNPSSCCLPWTVLWYRTSMTTSAQSVIPFPHPTPEDHMARFNKSTTLLAAVTAALVLTVALNAQQSRVSTTASSVATAVTNEVLRRAGAANDPLPGEWLSYGRGQSETRYSTLKQ